MKRTDFIEEFYSKKMKRNNYIFIEHLGCDDENWIAVFIKHEDEYIEHKYDNGDRIITNDYYDYDENNKILDYKYYQIPYLRDDGENRVGKRLDGPFYKGEIWSKRELKKYKNYQ